MSAPDGWPDVVQFGALELMEYEASVRADFHVRPGDGPGLQIGRPLAESLVHRRAVYSRNDVSWVAARAWRRDTKREDVNALRLAKTTVDREVVAGAADDVAGALRALFGAVPWTAVVTTTPVGHSRRPDSFAVRLGIEVANRVGCRFAKIFADRFVSGSSHPKEFDRLPPIAAAAPVRRSMHIVVDDVATSGWHMEEALGYIRAAGAPALGAAWISGTVK